MAIYQRSHHLLKKFGLTGEDYESLLAAQAGKCAICDRPERVLGKRLSVDHDHSTGTVRALLCHHCNSALGQADDNPQLLRQMAGYLEAHQ